MKQSIVIFVLGSICFFLLAASPVYADDHTKLYENYLSDKASTYMNRSEMLRDSKSPHLRWHAALCLQKASYYVSARQNIVRELNARKGPLKPHQIDVYLNDKFDQVSRENLRAAQ
ncbi:MAG: hypothetical protein VR64_02780 [Desulfatitalea sp. BRH_c12]|nr:MAG: hypothetical protein VR64_02780 [Desulfatitalea sp. BRH_c12]